MPDFMPQAFGEMFKKNFEALGAMQKELLEIIAGTNRAWLAHAQLETTLASEFFSKLAGARSAPDAAMACQDCMTRQLDLFAEDGQRLLADGEKLIRSGARLFSTASPGFSS
jgi:hypothetical protein